ncbi:3-phenylpropionate/cinnamic acid dioxygenase small subunit [Litorivivens lipolytica]|uniref:3-phenylpropionate/cinnamic acid dioxygenase small subunit n=1 Tax=Litorivivens lipolytica TaxID=1524264 RepID=A0A7W4Z5U4_9GAMM|nr:nuclear transport factor 2 family protein [Litorivivens lipolytica]MBB3047553.1 3-phenylpropionate/cinnamic acid dioxygenase small subunit [Litorivivens lipolytica]
MALTLEDRLEIRELLARYAHALDYHNLPAMRDIWTDDCRFQADEPEVNISGVDALIDFFKDTVAAVPHARHLIDNLYIEGGASEALCHAYLSIVDAEEKTLLGFGRYRDEVVRTASGWRIRSRVFTAG